MLISVLCNNFNDELAFGHYQCDRGINKGSVCTPVCDRGYEMLPNNHEGYLCNEFAQWIGSSCPQCVPGKYFPLVNLVDFKGEIL